MLALSAASIAFNLDGHNFVSAGRDAHLLSLYHIQFFMGVVLYRWRKPIARSAPALPLVVIGAALFPAGAHVLHAWYGAAIPPQPFGILGLARVILFGVPSVMMLAGLMALERRNPSWFERPLGKAMAEVGNASYGLYLSHIIVFAVLGKLFAKIWPVALPISVAAALAIAIAVIFSVFWYRWVELPYLKRFAEGPKRRAPVLVDGPA